MASRIDHFGIAPQASGQCSDPAVRNADVNGLISVLQQGVFDD